MRHHTFWIILGMAVCCLAGCGPRLVDVSGKVTYNGKPPNEEGVKIVFLGPNGKSVVGVIAPNGEYKASGVVAGANQVAIWYKNPEAAKSREPGTKAPPPTSVSPLRNLPFKYADVNTSELKCNADTGTVFDVDMTGKALQ